MPSESASPSSLEFVRIEFQSDLYRQAIALRHAVLRQPLGLAFSSTQIAAEHDQLHFGMLGGNALLACVSVMLVSPQKAKIRQMAVDATLQGRGIGSDLVSRVELELKTMGVQCIELHAREVARRFYERLGYAVTGEPFTEVTLPHIKMTKTIVTC
ncbi:putative acetyltransferase [Rhodopirellula maiorica SM1]|uniref:Putative acetyltransferase n=1 Tax=Rhodopirellula maiorica SM1 TaxID=1265738 RepID=M5RNT8_9BACT|nr:GNAT family N-acetyltransferase [Rhodopirellula maiorica]EMI17052.1 putative acetyltransferase [Rhodopirellula maiorica SM1]